MSAWLDEWKVDLSIATGTYVMHGKRHLNPVAHYCRLNPCQALICFPGSMHLWESNLRGFMQDGSITYGHAELRGQRLLTWMFGGGSLLDFWFAVVWCSNKTAGADPGTLYVLGLHPKCPHQGNIAFLLHVLCAFYPLYEFQAENANRAV